MKEKIKNTKGSVLIIVGLFYIIFVFNLAFPVFSFAQGVMGNITGANNTALQNDDGRTAREEAKGKKFLEKLQTKELTCKELSVDDFGTLGEYFMGQIMGNSHEAMNTMMVEMIGKDGEEQMHIVMGKRLSGCDTSAAFPSQSAGFMSMIQMMMGGGGNSMMNFGFMPFNQFGWIFMILWWVLIIVSIITLVKWLMTQSHGPHNHEKSPLEILKERYAKGEIDKKEFEERKRDLS